MKLILHLSNGTFIINHNEIIYLKAFSNYTQIYLTNNRKITVAKCLRYFEMLLANHNFIRLHRSYIVNKAYIETKIANEILLSYTNIKLPLAKRRVKNILSKLVA